MSYMAFHDIQDGRMRIVAARLIWLSFVITTLSINTSYATDVQNMEGRGINVHVGAGGKSFYENSYAIVIGINLYKKWPANLEYAVNDATAMNNKLKELGFKTTLLLNENATRERILREMGDILPKILNENDRVIFFFAGHGETEEIDASSKDSSSKRQMGYIIPYDAEKEYLYSTAISMEQIRGLSARLKAKHVLYIMDSCYSGLLLTARERGRGEEDRNLINGEYLKLITSKRAHQIITAGGKEEKAFEVNGHGIFTKSILDAINGAADEKKSHIQGIGPVCYKKCGAK
jgi:uncharacterized caspase-like protein